MERLLATHNQLLLPLVRAFKGRHVKSIGDALLLTFTSPTDAMLCAMAMQDRLHEYNIGVPEPEQIHIRVAASLGEVRVTKTDVFGDPVNLTSRVEAITPVDEIYLSEAVYLAMNKAEVPIKEVGYQELKGISSPVKIFSIPRFTSNRLVADPIGAPPPAKNGGRPSSLPNVAIQYPFGGAHVLAMSRASSNWMDLRNMSRPHGGMVFGLVGAGAAALLIGFWSLLFNRSEAGRSEAGRSEAGRPEAGRAEVARTDLSRSVSFAAQGSAVTAEAAASENLALESREAGGKGGITVVLGSSSYTPQEKRASNLTSQSLNGSGSALATPVPTTSPEKLAAMVSGISSLVGRFTEGNSASNVPLGSNPPGGAPSGKTGSEKGAVAAKQPSTQPKFIASGSLNQESVDTKPAVPKKMVEPKPAPKPQYRSIRAAKEAYRQGKIDRDRYREIANRLEVELDAKIAQLKSSYRSGQIDKSVYRERVRALKLAYE